MKDTGPPILLPDNRWKEWPDPLSLGITPEALVVASGRRIIASYPFSRIVRQFGRVRNMDLRVFSNQTAEVWLNDQLVMTIENPRANLDRIHIHWPRNEKKPPTS